VVSPEPGSSPPPPEHTLFVQRAEQATVRDSLLKSDDARCVVVEAAAGFGKSVLLKQVLDSVRGEAWVGAGCAERIAAGSDPLLPFQDVLEDLLVGRKLPGGILGRAKSLASCAV